MAMVCQTSDLNVKKGDNLVIFDTFITPHAFDKTQKPNMAMEQHLLCKMISMAMAYQTWDIIVKRATIKQLLAHIIINLSCICQNQKSKKQHL